MKLLLALGSRKSLGLESKNKNKQKKKKMQKQKLTKTAISTYNTNQRKRDSLLTSVPPGDTLEVVWPKGVNRATQPFLSTRIYQDMHSIQVRLALCYISVMER